MPFPRNFYVATDGFIHTVAIYPPPRRFELFDLMPYTAQPGIILVAYIIYTLGSHYQSIHRIYSIYLKYFDI